MKSYRINDRADVLANLRKTSTISLLLTILTMILPSHIAWSADEFKNVPLFDEGVMIQVPVNAFGKTLYFMVDSGFTASAIAAEYKPLLGEIVATSLDGGTPLGTDTTSPVFHCPEISIAGKPLAVAKIMCLNVQMLRLISGKQCDGILGADFFGKKVVSFDFDKHSISLLQSVPEFVKSDFVAQSAQRKAPI